MMKESDSPELREAYRLHQEACENLVSLKKKYGVAKRAHDVVILNRIIQEKTGKKLKMSMRVGRDYGPDQTVKSDFGFFLRAHDQESFSPFTWGRTKLDS